MEITSYRDFDKSLGKGAYGSVYKSGDKSIKIYRETIFQHSTKNPCLQLKRKKFILIKMRANKIKYTPLIDDLVYMNNTFSGVSYPYIEGTPLNKILKETSAEEKIRLSRQLIRNAKELTDHQIYPKDYRLPNILCDINGDIKIIDLDDVHTSVTLFPNPLQLVFSLSSLASLLTVFIEERNLDYKKYESFGKYQEGIRLRRHKILNYQRLSSYVNIKSKPYKTIFIDIRDIENMALDVINEILSHTDCKITLVSPKAFNVTILQNLGVSFYDAIVTNANQTLETAIETYLTTNNISKHLLFDRGQLSKDSHLLETSDVSKVINYLNEEIPQNRPREKQLIKVKNL